MPRDNSKNNDSSRGRRDRPGSGEGRAGGNGKGRTGGGKGRSGAARGPEKKFAKRGFGGKSDGEQRRSYGDKPDRAKQFEKKPYEKKAYSGSGKPYAGKRDDSRPPRRHDGDAPHSRGDRPFADRPQRFNRDDRPRDDKRPYTPRGERGDVRPAARFSDRKFGEKKPYTARDGGGEKRPYTPRGEGFRKGGDRPYGDRPSRDDDRPRGDRPHRKFGDAAIRSRGRNAMPVRATTLATVHGRPATARGALTSLNSIGRVTISRATQGLVKSATAMSARGSRGRARIVPMAIVPVTTVRDSIVRARGVMPGRSTRAARGDPPAAFPTGRAATTKTTARFSPSVRRSAAAAPIVSAHPTIVVRRGRRA
jgi:hypothetical protein